MRKIYLLILFCFCSGILGAQSVLNRAFDHYNDHPTGLARVNNNTYITSNIYGSYADSTCVYGIGTNGQLLFRKDIVKDYLTAIVKIIPTIDNNLALIGIANGCDAIDSSARTFFMRINAPFGFTLTDRNILPAGLTDNFRDIVQYPDSTFFIITDSLLFHFSSAGSQYSRRNTGLSGLKSIDINPAGNLVLSTAAASSYSICVVDTSGNLLSQQALGTSSLKTKAIANGYYTLNNVIMKRDAALQPLDSSSAAQNFTAGNSITDFVLDNDTIYACGHNNTANSSFILKLDTLLNLISMSANLAPGIVPRVIFHDNRTSLLISSQSSPALNNISGLYVAPDNAGYSFTKDVGITAIYPDSGYINPFISYYPPSGPYLYQLNNWYYKAKVTVRNFGSTPVQTVQVNQFNYYSIGCGGGDYYVRNFTNLHINPGDSAILDLGWVHHSISSIPVSGNPPSSAPVSICFNTSVPDNEHDLNQNNDGMCSTFTLPVIGLKDQKALLPFLIVFPNPASDQLTIESDAAIEMISVFDITGREMKKQETSKEKKHILYLDQFGAGIYLLKTETDKGTIFRKIVKE